MKLHIEGVVSVPGDKSLTHRALMLAGAARGESQLSGLLAGEDCRSTADVLRALGIEVPDLPGNGSGIVVRSPGINHWTAPVSILDCGNSGTTSRLMMGLLAGRPFSSTLTGDASLRSRPMRRITDPLTTMGARVTELERPDRLPLELHGGRLHGIAHHSSKASAQIKSAVIFAGLSGGVDVSVLEPVQSRDHTERMLRSLGMEVRERPEGDGWLVESRAPAGELPPLDMVVPGDPSSAAFLVALAALADTGELRVTNVGINPTRTGFFEAARRMGVVIEVENERITGGEPVGDLVVRPGRLRATEVLGPEVPAMIDEIPVLACLAARAEGETRITGADELRAKESDRITAIVDNLRAIGADAEELPDGLIVRGSDRPLSGFVRTLHDHRIAMAFGVLAALPGNRITIEAPEVADVSYPGFWDTIADLGGGAVVSG
ncbi:MAG: 3-phosphoshikimate 1-carboxyvinyltransferase [Gemmatimonadota bacterium]|jgi:3-phosphoshikimate 1-carboxyvinyltransferase|nr:3-phosphoshikimate 1-carboxyvinyltransferase [Gemmatimonadota bacterium]